MGEGRLRDEAKDSGSRLLPDISGVHRGCKPAFMWFWKIHFASVFSQLLPDRSQNLVIVIKQRRISPTFSLKCRFTASFYARNVFTSRGCISSRTNHLPKSGQSWSFVKRI